MNKENGLDCIVRFHDIRRLAELRRCVFSLVGQTYRPLNIILLLQRFSAEEIAQTHAALDPYLLISSGVTLAIHNYEEADPRDARTVLLNLGLSLAKGRYLAFLDYDDVLFPEAYSLLTERLRQSNAAIAFASVLLMQAHVYDKYINTQGMVTPSPFYGEGLIDLFRKNFCPLHSYVMDRQKIPRDLLYYDPTLTIEEDYDLLLRLCSQCESDFSLLSTTIGYYYYKTDGSNTVAVNVHDADLQRNYQEVCAKIENRRQITVLSPVVQHLLKLENHLGNLTISEVLQPRDQKTSSFP